MAVPAEVTKFVKNHSHLPNFFRTIIFSLWNAKFCYFFSFKQSFCRPFGSDARSSNTTRPLPLSSPPLRYARVCSCLEGVWGSIEIDPLVLSFGARRTWLVGFMNWSLYSRKTPQCPLNTNIKLCTFYLKRFYMHWKFNRLQSKELPDMAQCYCFSDKNWKWALPLKLR
jgi:hypothetical protein